MRRRLDGWVGAILAAGSAALVALVAYYEVLGYWFTGTDTIPLIETSRVATLGGAVGIFAEPLMEGSHFTDRALFYRPVASLSYPVDYWLWGLDPFGYHLTDLLLHASAAALVCVLVFCVLEETLTAAIAGWVFALHPLTVEVVPTPARRHDVLATVFALAALCLFVRATKGTLGAKREAAGPESVSSGSANESKGSTGADGSASPATGRAYATKSAILTRRRSLLVGGSVLFYLLALGSKEIAVVVPALVGTWFLVSVYGRRPSIRRAAKSGALLLGPYAVATGLYIILRSVVLGGLGGYDRPTGDLSIGAISVTLSRYVLSLLYPVDFVGAFSRLDVQLIPNGLYVVLAGVSILAVHNVSRTHVDRSVLASTQGRLLALSGVWFAVPVWLFVRTGRYTLRSGYISIVPVAVVLATLLVASAGDVRRRLRERTAAKNEHGATATADRGGRYESTGRGRGGGPGIATLVVVCVLVASLVAGSALVHPYNEWERAGETSEETLRAISGATEGVTANATLDVAPVPHPRSAHRMSSFPYARSVTFAWGNTIESWLRLRGQAGARNVYINETTVLAEAPERTTASVRKHGKRVAIAVHYDERCPNRPAGTDGETIGAHVADRDRGTSPAVVECEDHAFPESRENDRRPEAKGYRKTGSHHEAASGIVTATNPSTSVGR